MADATHWHDERSFASHFALIAGTIAMHKHYLATISVAALLLAACGKQDDTAAKSTSATSNSAAPQTQAAAQPASAADANAAPVIDRSAYTRTVFMQLTDFTADDWKDFEKTTIDAVENSSTTTPDQLAAIKFPGYASITNPFDKDTFQKAHAQDLTITATAPAKIRIVQTVPSRDLLPGNPLKGEYVIQALFHDGDMLGYSFTDSATSVTPDGKIVEKRLDRTIRYNLKFNRNINQEFHKTVSVDAAKTVESRIQRENGGAASVPVILYGTVQSVATQTWPTSSSLDVNVQVDAYEVGYGKGKAIKPLFD
ncbi:hypothetical protein C7401_112174 [Paraburkholderia unamae]|nr:hypothetical protein C7401_112174 [Paraburkholderia unamae]